MTVSQWADTFRQLPSESPEPGKWRTSRVPYMKSIMDAFTEPNISRVVVKSSAQVGKALDIECPIATPDGFKAMGDLVVGDKVFDENGEVCNVVGVSPIMYGHDCYEITFSDGAKIVADAEHNWYVQEDKRYGLQEYVKTTEEISRDFKNGNRNRYAVPVAKPLKLPEKDLPIDSYTLGAWLGDGNAHSAQLTLHQDDLEIARRIEANGHNVVIRQKDARCPHIMNIQIDPLIVDENICIHGHDMRIVGKTKKGHCAECSRQYAMQHKWKGIRDIKVDPIIAPHDSFNKRLRELGVLKNKHIPPEYLRGSYEQRLDLLRGLFDTDGTISKNGRCAITQKNKQLADDVMELLWTLGYKPTMCERLATFTYKGEKKSSLVYQITFMAYDDVHVFHLQRKLVRQKSRAGCRTTETFRRRIVNVEKVESRPVKCIVVDSPNHLFLAGRELIPTHNSEVLLNIVGRYAALDPCSIMIIQPTLSDAEDFSKVRLAKMIKDTKALTPLFYDRERTRDSNQTILSKFYKGGRIILVGANSSSGLASRPIRILLCDEVDRYPESAMGEGDPISLAEKRTSNYFNKKIGLFSTPTTAGASRIDIEYNLGTQEEWSHQCKNCGEWHSLKYDDMAVDYREHKDAAGNKSVSVRSVKWRCPDCGLEYSEQQMRATAQKYIAQNPSAIENGIRSFFVNGFCSPWLKWSEICREWLEAIGDPTREAVVCNTRFGRSYEPVKKVVDSVELVARLEEYGAELPDGVLSLTAGVDVQANRLHYAIYGYAPNEIWGIRYGVIFSKPTFESTWRTLDEILSKVYKFKDGTGLKVARTFIDSGFLPEKVYEFCRGKPSYFAIKGMGAAGLPIIHKISPLKEKNIYLVLLGVNAAKSEIFGRLERIHYGRDDGLARNFDATFFKELTSEQLVMKKSGGGFVTVYENIKRARNEALDCSCYSLAAMVSLYGKDEKRYWTEQAAIKEPETKKTSPPKKIKTRTIDIWN